MGYFPVPDPGRLVYARTRLQPMLSMALILKDGPTLQNINHLQVHVVVMPLASRVRPLPRLDNMHDRGTICSFVDTEISVLKIGPHAVVRKGPRAGMLNTKRHVRPPLSRCLMLT